MAETIHIGRKISRIREIRGIKQDYLAIEMGVSQQTISKIEQSETVEEDTLGKEAQKIELEKVLSKAQLKASQGYLQIRIVPYYL